MQRKSFNLDKLFYSESIVSQAKDAFNDFDIDIVEWVIFITDDDPQIVFDEFSNYCISIFNEQIV